MAISNTKKQTEKVIIKRRQFKLDEYTLKQSEAYSM